MQLLFYKYLLGLNSQGLQMVYVSTVLLHLSHFPTVILSVQEILQSRTCQK